MNERWTRGVRHALLFLLAPALGACAVGRLSDRIVIDAATQVTDRDGKSIPIGEDGDFLTTRNLVDGGGLKLQPGDVLTYTRWSPGFAVPGRRHSHEPVTEIYRIPLRKVDEAKGRLRAEEERLLASILTVQRLDWGSQNLYGQEEPRRIFLIKLQGVLFRNRIRLWNALVDALAIQRIGDPASGVSVVPVLRMNTLCGALEEHLKDAPVDQKQIATDDLKTFVKAFVNSAGSVCGAAPLGTRELTGLPESGLRTFLHAAASAANPGSDDSDAYFVRTPNPYAQFNFAHIERSGVRVASHDLSEGDWTLREWEVSGVCRPSGQGSKTILRRIRLAGGQRKIWISRDESVLPSTYRVRSVLTATAAGRILERLSDRVLFEERAVLPESALDQLHMSDLDWIEWGLPDRLAFHRKARIVVTPNSCYFPEIQ